MNWFFAIIRIAGASFPVSTSLVQAHSELEASKLTEKLAKFEDPISQFHEKIPELSEKLYSKLKTIDSSKLAFESEFYGCYAKPLAILESKGFIKGVHGMGKDGVFIGGLRIIDPTYMMYVCNLAEDKKAMSGLVARMESATRGEWLNGAELKIEFSLPVPVIDAVFNIYESQGYGLCSKEIGASAYLSNV